MAADRITRVSLVANVSNYVSGMNQAAAATRATGTAAERLAQQREGFESLGKALAAVGTVAAAGVGLAIKKFAEFDQAVSGIQAATHATTKDMGLLRDAALKAGADTVYSATEAANAITELSKAGLTTGQILGGGLNGALSLASAGGLEVADAANIAAVAVKQFNLAGSDVPHVADLLAAGAGKAVGDVSDLSAALGQAGLIANQTGLTIEETTGTLAAFADQGLLGSDAGTSLKTMLQALTPSSKQASDEMKRLGISAFDAQGNFIGISKFAGVYQNALKDLSPEQQATTSKIIFGSDAVRASNVLFGLGAQGIQKYIDQTNDQGYAAETARLKLDNLRGDVEKLGGSLDTALIQTGSSANEVLRGLTQSATNLVDSFGSAPKPLLASGLALGTLVAAIGLVGGGALIAVPKIVAFRTAMQQVGVGGRAAAKGIGALSLGLTAATVIVGAYVAKQGRISAATSELTSTLDEATGALTKYSKSYVAKQLADSGAFKAAKEAGVGQKELTEAILEGGDALDQTLQKFGKTNSLGGVFNGEAFRSTQAQGQIKELRQSVEDSAESFKDLKATGTDVADSQGQVTEAAADAATSLGDLSGAADTGKTSLDDLKSAIEGFGSAQLDVDSATRSFYESVDKLTESVKQNGQTLDVTTEKGRNNQSALDDIASSTLALSSATLTQTGSQSKAAAVIEQGRAAFIKAAGQLGINTTQAKKLADSLGLIPSNVNTAVTQTGVDPAIAKLDALIAKIRDVPGYKAVVIDQQIKQTGAAAGAVKAAYNAEGGSIVGPGTGTSDSILSFLSNGEYVIKAASVNKYGKGFLDALNSGNLPRFANGGAVNKAQAELDRDNAAYKAAQRRYQDAAKKDKPSIQRQVRDLQDQIAADKRVLAAAKAAPSGASSSDRVSFRSAVRSGDFDNKAGVSDLFSMAQDSSKYTARQRKQFADQANKSEVRMLKLEKASDKAGAAVEKAADRLDDLKDKSSSLASSVASNLSGQGVSDFGSASSFARGQSRTASTLKQLGPVLDKLKKKGLSPALIAQIAGLDPVEALRMAKSFDALSGSSIKSVNADYKSVQSTATSIGKQVADANYGPQIKVAQAALTAANRNAKSIATEIKNQGLLLRKVVGKGLGLKGYSAGGYTGAGGVNDVAGLVHAGEYVSNARTTARFRPLLESLQGYSAGGYVRPRYVRGGGSAGIDYGQLAAALGGASSGVKAEFHAHAKENMDAQTAMTIMSREIGREFSGMVR